MSGDYAYVADYITDLVERPSSLAVIDVSDPINPGTPVYEVTHGWAEDVYVSGDYAYLVNRVGLVIIEISDLINPGTPGGEIPFELIIIASVISGAVIGVVVVVVLIKRKK